MSDREQLRERLARVVADHLNYGGSDYVSTLDNDLAGNILDEIEAAGYVLMERGRAERLIEEARTMQAAYADGGWGESELQPGDLDPIGRDADS